MCKNLRTLHLAVGLGLQLLLFTLAGTLSAQTPDPTAVTPAAGLLPTALLGLTSATGVFSQYAFLVDKKARTLTVWQTTPDDHLKLIGAWPADIGE